MIVSRTSIQKKISALEVEMATAKRKICVVLRYLLRIY